MIIVWACFGRDFVRSFMLLLLKPELKNNLLLQKLVCCSKSIPILFYIWSMTAKIMQKNVNLRFYLFFWRLLSLFCQLFYFLCSVYQKYDVTIIADFLSLSVLIGSFLFLLKIFMWTFTASTGLNENCSRLLIFSILYKKYLCELLLPVQVLMKIVPGS